MPVTTKSVLFGAVRGTKLNKQTTERLKVLILTKLFFRVLVKPAVLYAEFATKQSG